MFNKCCLIELCRCSRISWNCHCCYQGLISYVRFKNKLFGHSTINTRWLRAGRNMPLVRVLILWAIRSVSLIGRIWIDQPCVCESDKDQFTKHIHIFASTKGQCARVFPINAVSFRRLHSYSDKARLFQALSTPRRLQLIASEPYSWLKSRLHDATSRTIWIWNNLLKTPIPHKLLKV